MKGTALPEVAGVEHRFVDIDTVDGQLRVHLAEAGDGERLLLLHGWPQHWYMWRLLVPALGERFRLLMPDLRGFGWSNAPGRGYDAPTFAADAVALLDALGIERVRLVGHDWGGFTSFLLGLSHPERIERMIVLSAPHPWVPRNLRVLTSLWRTWYVVANGIPGLGARAVANPSRLHRFLNLGREHEVITAESARIYAERLSGRERRRTTSGLYRSYLRMVARSLTSGFAGRRLTVPTRLVFGADDFYVPVAYLEGGERHGDDFQIELVPGTGHFIPEERHDLVADRILAFLG